MTYCKMKIAVIMLITCEYWLLLTSDKNYKQILDNFLISSRVVDLINTIFLCYWSISEIIRDMKDKADVDSYIDLYSLSYEADQLSYEYRKKYRRDFNSDWLSSHNQALKEIKRKSFDDMLGTLETLLPNLPYPVIVKILEYIVEDVEENETNRKKYKCFDFVKPQMLLIVQDLFVALENSCMNGPSDSDTYKFNKAYQNYIEGSENIFGTITLI